MLGLAGSFASLFFFFWQYPGTLTQFMGPKGEDYKFVANANEDEISIYRDNVLIASGINNANTGITSDDIKDLRRAKCRGTTLLWTMLIGGLLSVLFLLWWIVNCPNRFVCCSLQQPYEALQQQYGMHVMPHTPMPMMKTSPVPGAPTISTPPSMPTAATSTGPKLA
jgi:hypothetical protein